MKDREMNVVFSSDNNYAQHMGVAIYSLLENNKMFDKITIFIIDNQITYSNKEKLIDMVKKFSNSKIEWIDFEHWKQRLNLNMGKWSISLSSYARLFLGSMLKNDVDRVLYLDCDMIVSQSLYELWNTCLSGKMLAAVQDSVNDTTKYMVELKPEMRYFNAGMLLIDLKCWRAENMEKKCLDYIDKKNGNVVHHDQGVLNAIIRGNFERIPIKYNIMTIHYIMNKSSVMKYFGESAEFYKEEEIERAKQNPAILHFTPSFTSRPWISNCKHPLREIYWENIKKTPWRDAEKQRCTDKWYVRMINWKYRTLGV